MVSGRTALIVFAIASVLLFSSLAFIPRLILRYLTSECCHSPPLYGILFRHLTPPSTLFEVIYGL
jgi:hypothetical protein